MKSRLSRAETTRWVLITLHVLALTLAIAQYAMEREPRPARPPLSSR